MTAIPATIETQHCTQVAGVKMYSRELRRRSLPGGPVFVLVHGLGMSSRYMMPTARLLAAHGTVYVPDLPGFGNSGKPFRTLSILGLADVLAAWLDLRGVEQPVVIGNSLGAQVLADFAVRYPRCLSAAVLAAPTVDPEARSVGAQLFRLLRDLPREPVRLYGIGFSDYLKAGWVTILETLQHALEHPIDAVLPSIRAPVLLVSGERDPIMPQGWRQEAAHLIPRVKQVVLPGVAHAVNFSAPAALVEEVLTFLRPAEP